MDDKERKYAIGLMNKELNNFEKGKKQGAIDETKRWLRIMKKERWNKIYDEDLEERLRELEGVQK